MPHSCASRRMSRPSSAVSLVARGRRPARRGAAPTARPRSRGDRDQPAPAVRQLLGPPVEIGLEPELPHRRGRQRRERSAPGPDEVAEVGPAVDAAPRRPAGSPAPSCSRRARATGSCGAIPAAARRRADQPSTCDAVEQDLPRRAHEAGDGVDERGLPRAVRPDQADHLAGPHGDRQVVERQDPAEAHLRARRVSRTAGVTRSEFLGRREQRGPGWLCAARPRRRWTALEIRCGSEAKPFGITRSTASSTNPRTACTDWCRRRRRRTRWSTNAPGAIAPPITEPSTKPMPPITA